VAVRAPTTTIVTTPCAPTVSAERANLAAVAIPHAPSILTANAFVTATCASQTATQQARASPVPSTRTVVRSVVPTRTAIRARRAPSARRPLCGTKRSHTCALLDVVAHARHRTTAATAQHAVRVTKSPKRAKTAADAHRNAVRMPTVISPARVRAAFASAIRAAYRAVPRVKQRRTATVQSQDVEPVSTEHANRVRSAAAGAYPTRTATTAPAVVRRVPTDSAPPECAKPNSVHLETTTTVIPSRARIATHSCHAVDSEVRVGQHA